MKHIDTINKVEIASGVHALAITERYGDETYVEVRLEDFKRMCLGLHKALRSPVMSFFAVDEREKRGVYELFCSFAVREVGKWIFVAAPVPGDSPKYKSLAKDIFSASLFEREMKEMFGLKAVGNPDLRRLNLHDEVWLEGHFPLRKDFKAEEVLCGGKGDYVFNHIEGEGVFEVPVGPVHAGIIGPGHFRFSVAGEPIINLELRLGFTHRGVEKLFENKRPEEALALAEAVSGDAAFGHSLAFCQAVEKIAGITVPRRAQYLRAIFLELERLCNHAAGIGGIAIDVGFSYPAAYASLIKEAILVLNEKLTGSRYLKKINVIGGMVNELSVTDTQMLTVSLEDIAKDFGELKEMLLTSDSFLDRVEGTGVLKRNIAEDIGLVGMTARASGITFDLRKDFPGPYANVNFKPVAQVAGDVAARLSMRIHEFEESCRMIKEFNHLLEPGEIRTNGRVREGYGLGYTEAWRGPVLCWVKMDNEGRIERCKIVDASFHNWQGLSFAALGNIIPDFPACNKSFDLSYSGNDL